MKTEELVNWIKNPSQLNRESMLQLKAILEEYPCFAVARMLYLKSLLNLNDLHFSAALIKTAISVPDRRRLYYFIEGKQLPEQLENPQVAPLESGGFSLIDRFLQGSTPSVAPAKEEPEDYDFGGQTSDQSNENQPELPTDKPVIAEQPVRMDEGFVLNYAEFLSMQPDAAPKDSIEPMVGQDLIDRFLTNAVGNESKIRIQPVPDNRLNEPSDDDLTFLEQKVSSFKLPEDSFTDTLARIYLKQKRYDRALEIFKGLSLKYPEKNVYFADQIQFLEKLITHIKK